MTTDNQVTVLNFMCMKISSVKLMEILHLIDSITSKSGTWIAAVNVRDVYI